MAQRSSVDADARDDRIERTVDRMIGRRGLRPRSAAYLVIVLWLIAVVAFGVLQRVVDPDTYPTIWPALWWAVQTVTTVGYGDNVPQQAGGKVVASILMIGASPSFRSSQPRSRAASSRGARSTRGRVARTP